MSGLYADVGRRSAYYLLSAAGSLPPHEMPRPSLMWIYEAVRERVVEARLLLSHAGLNEQAAS